MAFPVTSTTIVDAYNNLRNATLNCQSYALMVQNTLTTSPPLNCSGLLNLLDAAVNVSSIATAILSDTNLTSNLVAYVQNVTGQATLDVQTEFSASLTSLTALIAAIQQEYPIDSNGFLLDRTFSNNTVSSIGFTTTQLPNTTAAIKTWLATIQ